MKAGDFIRWMRNNAQYDSQYYIYLNYIEQYKEINNSDIVSLRKFLYDKPEILIRYIDEFGISEVPNFIYPLINSYFKEKMFYAVEYILKFAKDQNKLNPLKREISVFLKECFSNKNFEIISRCHYYPNIKNLILEKNQNLFEEAVLNYNSINPEFKKELDLFNIQNNLNNF